MKERAGGMRGLPVRDSHFEQQFRIEVDYRVRQHHIFRLGRQLVGCDSPWRRRCWVGCAVGKQMSSLEGPLMRTLPIVNILHLHRLFLQFFEGIEHSFQNYTPLLEAGSVQLSSLGYANCSKMYIVSSAIAAPITAIYSINAVIYRTNFANESLSDIS